MRNFTHLLLTCLLPRQVRSFGNLLCGLFMGLAKKAFLPERSGTSLPGAVKGLRLAVYKPWLPAFLFLFCAESGLAQSGCPQVSLSSSGSCVGSQLTATITGGVSGITWKKNGTTLLTQDAGFASSGTTVAGGNGGGSGANQFSSLYGVYVDGSGNIYVADYGNHRVQKWAPGATSGTTVAGGNGYGSGANQLASPESVFVDGSGNVYVTDGHNHRIQKWDRETLSPPFTFTPSAAGSYTAEVIGAGGCLVLSSNLVINEQPTVSLSSSSSCVGSQLTATITGSVSGITWKKNGTTLLTQDVGYASSGTTVAGGNGGGSGANQLGLPSGVYVDGGGNVYVADFFNHRVQKWAPGATTGTTVAGGNGQGSGTNQLYFPYGVYVDGSGNIYVADYGNHRIQKWAPGATSGTTVAGGNGYGSGANQLDVPYSVFVDGSGNIYVADHGNHRIQKWAPGSNSGITVAGGNGRGSGANQLDGPTGVFVDGSGNIYVSDLANRIQKWAPGASSGVTVAGGNGGGSGANQLYGPSGIFVDVSGNVYVADASNQRIQEWAPGASSGTTVAGGNGEGGGANQFALPSSVYLDGSGSVYIADANNHRIQKWDRETLTYTSSETGSYTADVVTNAGCTASSPAVLLNAFPTGILYVNAAATGANNGSSWTDAYKKLQDALAANPCSGGEIWVAKGTYYPDEGGGKTNNDRTASFVLRNNLTIYGGFAGNETQLAVRDPQANVTILSGDIDQNDGTNFTNDGGNSYHVVSNNNSSLNSTAVLHGFTITAGNANGTHADSKGGGLYNNGSSPSIINCRFLGNSAADGGGMYTEATGGSSPTLTNCSFLANKAVSKGGGMYNGNSPTLTLTNCSFSANTADYGGALYQSTAIANIDNCSFSGNSATSAGGGMYNNQTIVRATNSIFLKNGANRGGGMYSLGNQASLTIANCSFSGNNADNGGAMAMDGASLRAVNSIFWGNIGGAVTTVNGGTADITYSIVQGGYTGTGNKNADPVFVDAANGNLRLQENSPAINAGLNSATSVTTDLAGNPRVIGGIIDMGAYEDLGLLVWNGNTSTAWNTASNWSTGVVPTAADDVLIPSAPANQPVVSTLDAVAKSVEVQSGATLTIQSGGGLAVNGSRSISGFITALYNNSTVQNSGKLFIGNLSSTGRYGMVNQATFNNNTSGQITIDRSSVTGLLSNIGTFTNAGSITIGSMAGVGEYGLSNSATFSNNAGGSINIDNTTEAALHNTSNSFTNAGILTIGASAGVGPNGLSNAATFTNVSGGEINIDRSTGVGLFTNGGTFTNNSKILIGAIADVGQYGVFNNATFNNTGCAALVREVSNSVINGGAGFSNSGTIIENATGSSNVNSSTGLVQNLNGGSFSIATGGIVSTRPDIYWKGCTSTDWNTASNWSSWQVPTAADDVIIPAATNQPVISTTGAMAKTVEVQSGATLTIQSGGGLAVNGFKTISSNTTTFYNNGSVQNSGALLIGNVSPVGEYSLWNNATFNNNAGGLLSIDRSTGSGLYNSSGTFTNNGTVTIGEAGSVGSTALSNSATFNNSGCSSLLRVVSDNIIVGGAGFTNSGRIVENASGNSNIGTNTNTGVVENLNVGTFTITNNSGVLTTTADYYGNPTVFGNNQWTVYAYNSGNGTLSGTNWTGNYAGKYTSTAFNFNTTDDWAATASPSSAATYAGCPVQADNFSFIAKRQGFPCGNYSIDLYHDDAAQLYVNGTRVWESDGYGTVSAVWTGVLGANDKIEFRVTDGAGGGGGQLTFNKSANTVLYVDRSKAAGGNGTSWATAYNNLQDALAAVTGSSCNTEVWVAKGTYYPDMGSGITAGDRRASFVMKNSVAIYGGFAGTETQLSQRNWQTHVTILSGDIDQNDGPNFANYGGNSYHVVFNNNLNSTAILDGFTIRGGNANGRVTPYDGVGGGIFNEIASPRIANCTITANITENRGGGIYNSASSPVLDNCSFIGNRAVNGGGIYNVSFSSAIVTNCIFSGNIATSQGGGVFNSVSASSFINCSFAGNNGGAI